MKVRAEYGKALKTADSVSAGQSAKKLGWRKRHCERVTNLPGKFKTGLMDMIKKTRCYVPELTENTDIDS